MTAAISDLTAAQTAYQAGLEATGAILEDYAAELSVAAIAH